MSSESRLNVRPISETLEKYREIFYNLNIMVVLHDIEGNIYEVNNKFLETFGYTRDEIPSLNIAHLQSHETHESCGAVIADTMKYGSATREVTLKKKNRETFPACIHTNLIDIDDNKVMLCVIDDISHIKKVEKELRESNLFLDSIIENIPHMIFLKDARDLRFVRFNKAGEELLGFSRDELIGKNDYDFFPKEEADFFTSEDRKVLKSDNVLDIPEEPIHTKEKGERTLHTKKIAIHDDMGNPTYLLGISEDITERKLSEEMFKLVVESSPFAIVMVDEEGRIKLVNSQTEKMFGYDRSELSEQPVELLIPANHLTKHLENRNAYFKNPWTKHAREGRDLIALRKDGTEFPVEIGLTPIHTNDGLMVLASVIDITERKKTEDALREAHDQLELRVIKRTADLSELNKKLKAEIETRKQAEDALKANLEKLSKKNRYEEIVSTVTRTVHQSLDLNEVLENAVGVISKNVNKVGLVTIYMVEGDTAVLKAHRGLTEEYIRKAGRVPYGKGSTWHTILEGRCKYVPNVDEDKIIGDAGRMLGQKSYVAVPLLSSNIAVGVIFIASFEKNAFDDEEIRLLKIVSQQIGVAINNAKRAHELKENLEQISKKNHYEEIISSVTQSVNQSKDLQEVFDNTVKAIHSNMNAADNVAVFLVEGEFAVMKSSMGYMDSFAERVSKIRYPKGLTWETINKGEITYCPDADNNDKIGPAGKEAGTKSHLSIPLKSDGNAIGVINLNSLKKDAFRDDDIKLLEVVGKQIEIAINKRRDAEALRHSEERYRTLYDENPAMYFTINEGRIVLSVNRHGIEELGYSEDELIGHSVLSVFHEEDREKIKRQLNKCFANPDQIFRWELRKVHKDGNIIWVNEMARCVIDASGHKVTLVACINITERKKAEKEKREAEERYRTIVENTYNMILETDIFGNISYANPLHKEILGYESEELIGMNCLDLVYEEDRQEIAEAFQRAALTGESVETACYRCRHKNGELRWLESTGKSYVAAPGEIRGVISSRDITERKKAEDARREIEDRHRALIEHSYDIIVETTSDGRFSYLNPTFTEVLGYNTDELLGRDIFEFVHIDDVSHVSAEFLRVMTTFDTGNAVFRFRHRNGEWRWLESSGRPFKTASGEIRASISTRDITERKRSEEALRESEERYRTLVENSYDLIIEVSIDCKFLYLSPNHQLVLGYRPEDLIGKNIFENIHPEDRQSAIDSFTIAARNITEALGLTMSDIMSGNIFDTVDPQDISWVIENLETAIEKHRESENTSVIYRYKNHNGDWRWLESTGRPFLTSEGEIRIVVSSRDITERKQSEDRLKSAFAEIERLKNQLERENIYLQEEIKEQYRHGEIYGRSKAIEDALSLARQVADTESTVLLQGETGTGKELMAHAIHNMSPRKDRAMITINCAVLPPSLIDTELFGHEKGAFTGATSRRPGRFELADGSTLFLDEVIELPLELQSKLLRVLQTGEFERLGSTKTLTTDVRVIAATNRDLANAVQEGTFREDLFYRLNVFPIHLPPLRDRKEDIPLLVDAFVKEFSEKMGKNIDKIPKKTMSALQKYRWPGNVRELRNVIERGVIISKGNTLHVDLPGVDRSENKKAKQLYDLEKEHITEILSGTNWRVRGKGGAAEILGMKPTTLESRMRKLGIKRSMEKS